MAGSKVFLKYNGRILLYFKSFSYIKAAFTLQWIECFQTFVDHFIV